VKTDPFPVFKVQHFKPYTLSETLLAPPIAVKDSVFPVLFTHFLDIKSVQRYKE